MGRGTIESLIETERLPRTYRDIVELWWRPLAARLASRTREKHAAIVVGINGPQGSGKSTACRFLAHLLADEEGLKAATLSLDDIYLTRAKRARLASTVHPLLATRGVPGTHDLALGHAAIDRALHGSGVIALPLFDKARDDRAVQSRWPVIEAPVDVLLFEGWCIGARPQPDSELVLPANELEAIEDAEGIWRRYANSALAEGYTALFARLDMVVMLRPPGFAQVQEWRQLQERKLVEATGKGMTPREVEHFVMHYERLTRHMLATMPASADIIVEISSEHVPVATIPRLDVAANIARSA